MNLNSGIIHALCAPYLRLGVEGRGALTAPEKRPNSSFVILLTLATFTWPRRSCHSYREAAAAASDMGAAFRW